MLTKRISAIDQFRGLAILAMSLGHYMTGVRIIPAWMKRSPDIGLTVADLGAPLFIFAIGLTYDLSFTKRVRLAGFSRTYGHFAQRYLAIFGAGALMCAVEDCYLHNPTRFNWSILETIGLAGLLTLAVIRLRPWIRGLIGLLLLVSYQILLNCFLLGRTIQWPMGGPIGALSWTGMLILATALAGLYHEGVRRGNLFRLAAPLLLITGAGLSCLVPVSQNRVSLTYVLIGLGVSGLIFTLVDLLDRRYHFNLHALVACGKNSFALFILHYALIGVIFMPGIPALYAEAPLWLVILEMSALMVGVIAIALFMERKNIFFTL